MTLAEIKKELKSLFVKDLSKTLKKIESYLKSDSSLSGNLIILQGSYSNLKQDEIRGIISNEDSNLRRNKLRYSILQIIDAMDEDDVNQEKIKNNVTNSSVISISSQSEIYISYAWRGESEEVVNLLDAELQKRNIKVIRDKRDLGYKGSITEFMKDIGKGNKVIVIISKKYLESENCMFELTQVYENKDFAKRIFPIVLEDANIYSPISRIKYIKYWNDKIVELDEAIKSVGTSLNMSELQQELNNYGNIRAAFDKMSFILKDMNALTPEIHRGQNFEVLYKQLTSS